MAENVKVAVRVRPFNNREKERNATSIIRMEGKTTHIMNPDDKKEKSFTYDFSYNSYVPRNDPSYASQDTVWDDIGVSVLENAYNGYNCSLFAYGQTGSGKSYSMMGYGEDKGIIPIAAERIFERIRSNTDPDLTIRVEASMLEIYMEKVKDLFNPGSGDLKVRLNPAKGFYVENLTRNAVADYTSISKLMDAGSKARTVAATNMNATSSRAHTIFQILLTQTKVDRNAGTAKDKTALINLIDLAGSERADSTGATGDRLKEGSAINLSLSSLGNVISALAVNSDPDLKKKVRVPFRDSVLTMLLENSLGGNSKTAMIAAVSPADINYDETLGTLRYADRAKQIKNKAVVNEDPNEKLIRGLRDEIEALRKALAGSGGSLGGGGGGGDLEEERRKMQAEISEERDRIRKELEEKIKQEMEESKTWDEKLADTRARQEVREKELAEMGVLTGAAREAQLEKAKTVPHVTNLNEDKQLDRQLIFFCEPEGVLAVGRKDSDTPKDIKLAGVAIQKEHAIIRHIGGGSDAASPPTITIEPASPQAKVYVNGTVISSATPLHHGSRIVFGMSHVYYMIFPGAAEAGTLPDGLGPEDVVDQTFALNEMNKAQMQAMAAEETRRRGEAEEERRKTEARVAEIEARMMAEKVQAQKEANERLKVMEEKAIAMAGNEEQLRQLKEAQEKLTKDAQAKQAELEAKLRAQVEETQKLQANKERNMRERSLLDEQLLKTIPLVNEANAISEELGKHMSFEPKLMASSHAKSTWSSTASSADGGGGGGGAPNAADQMHTQVFVRVEHTDGSSPMGLWQSSKFVGRLYAMREMYQVWSENNRSFKNTQYDPASASAVSSRENTTGSNPEDPLDPFFDPPEDTLVGKATIYLDSLHHMLSIEEATPVINYAGKDQGELVVRVIPHTTATPPKSAIAKSENKQANEDEDELEEVESLEEIKGKKLNVSFFIDAARGLPSTFTAGFYVKFNFYLDGAQLKTPVSTKKTINPRWGWYTTVTHVVTEELIKYVAGEPLEIELWAPPAAGAASDHHHVTNPTTTATTPHVPAAAVVVVVAPTAVAVPSAPAPAPAPVTEEVKAAEVPKTTHATAKVAPEAAPAPAPAAPTPAPAASEKPAGGCCTVM